MSSAPQSQHDDVSLQLFFTLATAGFFLNRVFSPGRFGVDDWYFRWCRFSDEVVAESSRHVSIVQELLVVVLS